MSDEVDNFRKMAAMETHDLTITGVAHNAYCFLRQVPLS